MSTICDYCDATIDTSPGTYPTAMINRIVLVDPANVNAGGQPTTTELDFHNECLDPWLSNARKVKGQKPPKKV